MASFDDRKQASRRADIGPGDKYGWHHAPGSFYLPYKILRSWMYDSFLYEVDSPLYEKCTYETDPSVLYTCHFEPYLAGMLSLCGPRCTGRGSCQTITATRDPRAIASTYELRLPQGSFLHSVLLDTSCYTGGDSHPRMPGCIEIHTVTVGIPPAGISARSLQVVSDLCLDTLLVGDAQPPLFSGVECIISTIGFAYDDIPTHPRDTVIVCSELDAHATLTATLGREFTSILADRHDTAPGRLLTSISNGAQQTWIDTGTRRSMLFMSIPSVYRFRDAVYKGLSPWIVTETITVVHAPECGYAAVGCFHSRVPISTHIADITVPCVAPGKTWAAYPPAAVAYTHAVGGCLTVERYRHSSLIETCAHETFVMHASSSTHLLVVPQPAATLDWDYHCLTPEFDFCNVQVRLNAFDIDIQYVSDSASSVLAAIDYNSAWDTAGQWQVCAYSHDPCVLETSFIEVHCTTPGHLILPPVADNYAAVCVEPIVAEFCIPNWTLPGAMTVLPYTKSFEFSAPRVTDTVVCIPHYASFVMCGSGATGMLAHIDDNALIIQGPWQGSKPADVCVALNEWIKVEIGYVKPITIIGTYGDSYGVASTAFTYGVSCVPALTNETVELPSLSTAQYFALVPCAMGAIAIDGVHSAGWEPVLVYGAWATSVYELTGSIVVTEEWGHYCPRTAIAADSYEFTNAAPLRPAYNAYSAAVLGGDVYIAPMPTTKSVCWFPATAIGTLFACVHPTLVSLPSITDNAYVATDTTAVYFPCATSAACIDAIAADTIDMTCTERIAPMRVIIDWWRVDVSRSVTYRQGDEAVLSVPGSVYKGFYGVRHLRRENTAYVIESVLTPYFDCSKSRCDKFSVAPSELPVATGSILSPDRRPDNIMAGLAGMPVQYRADNWYGFAAVYKGLSYAALISAATSEIGILGAFTKCGNSSGCWYVATDIGYIENVMTDTIIVPINMRVTAACVTGDAVVYDVSTSTCEVMADELAWSAYGGGISVVPSYSGGAYAIGMETSSRDNFALIVATGKSINNWVTIAAIHYVADTIHYAPVYVEYAYAITGVNEAVLMCAAHIMPFIAHTATLAEVYTTSHGVYENQGAHTVGVELGMAYLCEVPMYMPASECVIVIAAPIPAHVSAVRKDGAYAYVGEDVVASLCAVPMLLPAAECTIVIAAPAHPRVIGVYNFNAAVCVYSVVVTHVADSNAPCHQAAVELDGVKEISIKYAGSVVGSVPDTAVYAYALTVAHYPYPYVACHYARELDGVNAVQEPVTHLWADCAVSCTLAELVYSSCAVSYAGTAIATQIDGLTATASGPMCASPATERVVVIADSALAECGCYHSYAGAYYADACGGVSSACGITYAPILTDTYYVLEHEGVQLLCGASRAPAYCTVSVQYVSGATSRTHQAHIKCNCGYVATHLSGHLMCAVKCPIFTGIEIDAVIPTYEVKDPIFVYVPVCPTIHLHYDFQEDSATQLSFIL